MLLSSSEIPIKLTLEQRLARSSQGKPKWIKLLLAEQARLKLLLVCKFSQCMLTETALFRITVRILFYFNVVENRTHRIAGQELQNGIVLHAFDQIPEPVQFDVPDFDALIFVIQTAARPHDPIGIECDFVDYATRRVDRAHAGARQIGSNHIFGDQ